MIDGTLMETAPAKAYATRPRASARPSLLMDALAFVIPCLIFLEVVFVGRLFASEILLFVMAPFLFLFKGRLLAAPMPRTLLLLGLMWLLSQVVTDLIRDTPFADYSRGWAKISFTLFNFAALYMLLANSRRRLVLFSVGLVIGGFLTYYFNPPIEVVAFPWKFGLAKPVTLLLVLGGLWSFARHAPRFVSLFLIFATGLNLINGSRGLAGICFVTAVFLFVQSRRLRPGARISQSRIFLISIIGIMGAVGFIQFYGYAASEGLLGRESQLKYDEQTSDYGVLIGGRREVLVAIQAIAESPFIGHGSWARNSKYAAMLHTLYGFDAKRRAFMRATSTGADLIPTHSFITGAWVEAGILGAVFWAYVLWLTVRNLFYLNQMREILTPLVAYFSFLLIWNIAFSPFGSVQRLLAPFYIITIMFCWDVVLAHRRSRRARAAPP